MEKYKIVPVPTRILTHHDDILFELLKALSRLRRAALCAARSFIRAGWQTFCRICSLLRAASAAGTACRRCWMPKAVRA